jgi:hypothetical protein
MNTSSFLLLFSPPPESTSCTSFSQESASTFVFDRLLLSSTTRPQPRRSSRWLAWHSPTLRLLSLPSPSSSIPSATFNSPLLRFPHAFATLASLSSRAVPYILSSSLRKGSAYTLCTHHYNYYYLSPSPSSLWWLNAHFMLESLYSYAFLYTPNHSLSRPHSQPYQSDIS